MGEGFALDTLEAAVDPFDVSFASVALIVSVGAAADTGEVPLRISVS